MPWEGLWGHREGSPPHLKPGCRASGNLSEPWGRELWVESRKLVGAAGPEEEWAAGKESSSGRLKSDPVSGAVRGAGWQGTEKGAWVASEGTWEASRVARQGCSPYDKLSVYRLHCSYRKALLCARERAGKALLCAGERAGKAEEDTARPPTHRALSPGGKTCD